MGIHESKSSTSSSSSSSSSRDQRRRCRRNYTLIASNNKHVEVGVAAEANGENKGDLAVCLASISLMALTGEDTHLPKPGSSFSSTTSAVDRSLRNPFGRKKSSASWNRSFSTPASAAAAAALEPASAATTSIKAVKRKICEKLRFHKQQQQQRRSHREQMEDDLFLAEHFNKHVQLLDCLEHEDDESSDWATMRSWLVWCLHNKLGDIESKSNTDAEEEGEEEEEDIGEPSTSSSSFRIASSTSRKPRSAEHHQHQLRRQLALDDRSRIVSSSHVLRRQETSFDGASICTPQSSFESYGSTGTGGGS